MRNESMKVFVCVNSYADGEYLFVRGSLESAKQAMKERCGEDVVIKWDDLRMNHGVYRGERLAGWIIEETIE